MVAVGPPARGQLLPKVHSREAKRHCGPSPINHQPLLRLPGWEAAEGLHAQRAATFPGTRVGNLPLTSNWATLDQIFLPPFSLLLMILRTKGSKMDKGAERLPPPPWRSLGVAQPHLIYSLRDGQLSLFWLLASLPQTQRSSSPHKSC